MSLLESARRMDDFCPYFRNGAEAICWYCRESVVADGPYHAADCPWLSMPKIVAVLEVAERARPWIAERCVDASCQKFSDTGKPHSEECDIQALVAALKGETA